MACGCGSGCDDGAASRRLLIIVDITVQEGEERDTSIIHLLLPSHHNKVQSTVVNVGIRLNDSRRNEF